MRGAPARKSEQPTSTSNGLRTRTPSPSRRKTAFKFEPAESEKEQALKLEQELVHKYGSVAHDRELCYLDDVYVLIKKIPFLQSRNKEELRRIALKTKDMEVSMEKTNAELKGMLVQAVEACLESAQCYLSKAETEKYGLTLEKCSKMLVLLSVDEPLNPVLHIKYDLVRSLAEGVSESNRYQMLQSVLVKLQSQPRMEYITAVVHLLLNLAHFRIEGKLSYNHVKNATSFFVRRLGLNGETKPDTPDPDLYLLTRKINLHWKEQQEVFSIAACCSILVELCLRIQQKEILADSANLSRKCKFYVSYLPRPFRKLLEKHIAVICERMEIERKLQLLRDPEFGKGHGVVNRNFLARNIQVSVNKANETSRNGELGAFSNFGAGKSSKQPTDSALLLFKSAEPRSQEEIIRMGNLERGIPIFPEQVDDAFMAKYSIPQEFIQGREYEKLMPKRKRKKQDLFKANVKFDWSGNTRWIVEEDQIGLQQKPLEDLEARKNTIPSQFQDHNSSEDGDNVSVDHELNNLVGLISRQKLSQLTPDYKSQPSQIVKRRFTINTITPAFSSPTLKLDNKLNESETIITPSENPTKMNISSHTLIKKGQRKVKDGIDSAIHKYRGISSFYYKETFRKNPEYLFSQRPSNLSTRTTVVQKLPIQNTTQPLPDFVTTLERNKSEEPKRVSNRIVLARQSSATTLRNGKPQLMNLESGDQQGMPGSAPELLATRRRSVSHRVTSTRGIIRTVAASGGLLAKGIPTNEPFLPSEIEELQGLLTLAERRTSEDLMTKRNPTKAKRLLRKAMGFILEHGTKEDRKVR